MSVYEDGDPAAQVLVLIHGFGESAAVWEAMVERLDTHHRVLRVDLLGHGASDESRSGYGVPEQAAAVLTALEGCGIDRAHFIAHSAGGDVVVSILEQAPGHVISTTLLGTAPHPRFVNLGGSARLMRVPLVGRALWSLATDAMFRQGLAATFAPDFPSVPDVYVESLRRLSYRAYAEGLAGLERYKRERDLCARAAPVGRALMVVFGDRDRWVDPSAADAWRQSAHAHVERMAHVGHTHMAEAPSATADLVLRFVAGVSC